MRIKVLIFIAFLYLFPGIVAAQTGSNAGITLSDSLSLNQTTIERDESKFLIHTAEGWSMKVSFLNNAMVRVQMAPATGFESSLTERFGFVRSNWKETPVTMVDFPGYTILQGENVGIKISKQDLRISLLDNQGNEITGERAARSWLPAGGGRLRFSMPADEHIFGFGFQRKTMDCRDYKFDWKREFRKKEATIPFFLSTKGYAFLSNNTFASLANGYDVTAVDGQLDFYFIYGPQFANILDNYTQLTGTPQVIPKWGLGLLYGCRYFETQQGVLDIACNFRKFDIPCDMMWLEPGWENHT